VPHKTQDRVTCSKEQSVTLTELQAGGVGFNRISETFAVISVASPARVRALRSHLMRRQVCEAVAPGVYVPAGQAAIGRWINFLCDLRVIPRLGGRISASNHWHRTTSDSLSRVGYAALLCALRENERDYVWFYLLPDERSALPGPVALLRRRTGSRPGGWLGRGRCGAGGIGRSCGSSAVSCSRSP
jgi:hypothetical protein